MSDEPEVQQDTRGLNHEDAAKTVADIHAKRGRGEALTDAQHAWLRANSAVFAEYPQPQGKPVAKEE